MSDYDDYLNKFTNTTHLKNYLYVRKDLDICEREDDYCSKYIFDKDECVKFIEKTNKTFEEREIKFSYFQETYGGHIIEACGNVGIRLIEVIETFARQESRMDDEVLSAYERRLYYFVKWMD